MAKQIRLHQHLAHFILLLGVLILGAIAVLTLSLDRQMQQYAVMAIGIAYVLWGIFHHHIEGDLHPRVLLEYIIMAMLASSILLSIIIRA